MHHNGTTSKTDAWRKTPEGRHRKISLTTFYLSIYCKGSKGLLKGCMWEDARDRTYTSYFDPTVMTVTLCLVLLMLGSTPSGLSEGPLDRVWPSLTTSGLYCLEVCWQLHRGFPRSPSVGCGLPYHISSLTLWESAGNCSGTQTQLS